MLARPSVYLAAASGFKASIAGPSRQSKCYTPITRFASTSTTSTSIPRPPPRTPPKPRPASSPGQATPFAPRSPVRSGAPPTAAPARQAAWPWRPSAHSPPGYTDLERTIYARPFEGPLGNRVRMLWFLVPFWGMVVGFYLTTPELPPPKPVEGEEPTEVAKETVGSTLWFYAAPAGMFATSLICFAWLASPSRFVTRLTQIRRQAISSTSMPPAGAKPVVDAGTSVVTKATPVAEPIIKEGEFIRMQHGGHLMCWGEMERGREVAMEDVRVNLIGSQVRSPYLSLNIKPTKKMSFDSVSYRLDFRDTPVVKASEDEVVLSLSRIEHVFGKLV